MSPRSNRSRKSSVYPQELDEIPWTDSKWFRITKICVIGTLILVTICGVIAYIVSNETESSGEGLPLRK